MKLFKEFLTEADEKAISNIHNMSSEMLSQLVFALKDKCKLTNSELNKLIKEVKFSNYIIACKFADGDSDDGYGFVDPHSFELMAKKDTAQRFPSKGAAKKFIEDKLIPFYSKDGDKVTIADFKILKFYDEAV